MKTKMDENHNMADLFKIGQNMPASPKIQPQHDKPYALDADDIRDFKPASMDVGYRLAPASPRSNLRSLKQTP